MASNNPPANPPHYPGITDPPFRPHPYANLFDRLSDEQLKQLAMDIDRTGQLLPIQIYGGRILDGRNRYAAIALINKQRQKQGIKPLAIKYGDYLEEENEENDKLAWAFVRANNYYRRLQTAEII
jgi:ParB-like chromosome segregation protein Spo0J